MTKLLAVETSAGSCSVAVHANGSWIEDIQNVQRLHNQVLLRQIDRVTQRAGVDARDLDVIAFGAGPGSFTGIRIAAATAQALAFAAGGLVVAVSSSHALAVAARGSLEIASPKGVVTVTRSRRDAHYVAAYEFAEGECRQVVGDTLHLGTTAPDFEAARDWPGIGDRPPWWGDLEPAVPFLEGIGVTAGIIGRLALAIHAAGGAVAAEAGLPVYVSGDSPWRPS
jgi:tRNA threonylcarbamoyladenosine biosynthesis protein TsaB